MAKIPTNNIIMENVYRVVERMDDIELLHGYRVASSSKGTFLYIPPLKKFKVLGVEGFDIYVERVDMVERENNRNPRW